MSVINLAELEKLASELELELSQTQVLLRHIRCYEARSEDIADYVQRTEDLEAIDQSIGPWSGLTLDS